MTAYEQGFLSKCAEYGIDGRAMLVDKSGYEDGFLSKCAEYGIDGRQALEGMRKQALSPLTRLMVKLQPRVDPEKLNGFTRLFTRTKTKTVPIFTKIKELGDVGGTARKISPLADSAGTAGTAGGAASSIEGGVPRSIIYDNPEGFKTYSTTRLAPDRILAALGGTAGLAGIANDIASSGAGNGSPVAPGVNGLSKTTKMLLAALGIGGAGAAAGYATAKSRSSDDDDEKKKKKRSTQK